MNVNFGKFAVLGAALALAASPTVTAHAATFTVNGSFYELGNFDTVPPAGSPATYCNKPAG